MADQKISALTLVSEVGATDDLVIVQGGVTKKCNPSQVKASFLQPFNEVLTTGVNVLSFSQSLGSAVGDWDYVEKLFDSEGNFYVDYTITKIDEDSFSVTVSENAVILKLIAYLI